MAGSYNHVTLVGNLTRDPEIRYVDGGAKGVTKFALAINRKTKGGDETMYVDIVAWDRLGEVCNQYLKKGMSALVSGRLVIRKYDDKDGNKRTAVEIVASDMQMLDSKGRSNGEGGGSYATAGAPAARSASDGFDDAGDDEIPF